MINPFSAFLLMLLSESIQDRMISWSALTFFFIVLGYIIWDIHRK